LIIRPTADKTKAIYCLLLAAYSWLGPPSMM